MPTVLAPQIALTMASGLSLLHFLDHTYTTASESWNVGQRTWPTIEHATSVLVRPNDSALLTDTCAWKIATLKPLSWRDLLLDLNFSME